MIGLLNFDKKTYFKKNVHKRLTDSVELALKQAAGMVILNQPDKKEDKLFSEHFACVDCNISYEDFF